jgi:hypothetical protein
MHTVSMPRPPDRQQEQRVTVALGSALLIQSALALIWAGAASERIAQLERRADANAAVMERTARLEEQVEFIAAALVRIESKIDRQAEEKD